MYFEFATLHLNFPLSVYTYLLYFLYTLSQKNKATRLLSVTLSHNALGHVLWLLF